MAMSHLFCQNENYEWIKFEAHLSLGVQFKFMVYN